MSAGWVETTGSGRWRARYRTTDNAKRSRTFATKGDARRWLNDELSRLQRGEWVDPRHGKTQVGVWAERVMATRIHTRASTRAKDRSYLGSLVLPAFGDRTLASVTPVDIQQWISELTSRGYAPSTIVQAFQLLRATFTAAVDADLLARSPVRGIRLPPKQHREMRFLTPAEFGELAVVVADRYRLLVNTAVYTGLRFSELAGLWRDDVDPLRKTVTVRRGLVEVNGKAVVGEPKTAASRRTVTLPSWLREELAFHLAAHNPLYVFTAPRGGALRRSGFRSRAWVPATVMAGLEEVRFHDLRHSHVAWLIEAGEHPKVIQSRLGHTSISTTLDRYGHLMAGLDAAAAEALPAPVNPSPSSEVPRIY